MKENKFKLIVKAMMAGCAISLGGLANIYSQNNVIGSLFFCIGLFVILVWNLNLFTGKICFCFTDNQIKLLDLFLVYIGNIIGCVSFGYLMRIISLNTFIENTVLSLHIKVSNPWFVNIIKGFMCNLCIYIAVIGYRDLNKEVEKILSLILGVSVFVLCKFEHCIADVFYISFCNLWNLTSLVFIVTVTVGNILGGITIPIIFKFLKRLEK